MAQRADVGPVEALVEHSPKPDATVPPLVVAGLAKATTCRGGGKRLSERRVDGRARASLLVARALEGAEASVIARTLGLTPQALQHFADPANANAIALGDVLATPRTFARAVLAGAQEELELGAPVSSASLERQVVSAVADTMQLLEIARLGDVERQPTSVLEQLLRLIDQAQGRLQELRRAVVEALRRRREGRGKF